MTTIVYCRRREQVDDWAERIKALLEESGETVALAWGIHKEFSEWLKKPQDDLRRLARERNILTILLILTIIMMRLMYG